MSDPSSTTGRMTTDTGPFAIIPEWLLDADVSDRAIRLYAILARYADHNGEAFPSRKKLAERLKCSVDSVDRAKEELIRVKALIVEARHGEEGGQRSNLYIVARLRPGGRRAAATPLGTGAAHNENHVERESPSDSQASSESRKRNLVWEALDEVFHPATPSERSNVGKTEREIRAAMKNADDAAIADEIRRRVAAYWPGLTKTPSALRQHWSELGRRADAAASSDKPPGGVITREWMFARNGPCQSCDGSGAKGDTPFTCPDCGGTGIEGWIHGGLD